MVIATKIASHQCVAFHAIRRDEAFDRNEAIDRAAVDLQVLGQPRNSPVTIHLHRPAQALEGTIPLMGQANFLDAVGGHLFRSGGMQALLRELLGDVLVGIACLREFLNPLGQVGIV